MNRSSWYHPNITGIQAEQLLMNEGKPGSFLVRDSQSAPGAFSLSVRLQDSVTHVKINNDGDCYDLLGPGGETFCELDDLIKHYMEGGEGAGTLKEKNGTVIELKIPLPNTDHSNERFFHRDISNSEADQRLKSSTAQAGTFLVRNSQRQPGNFVISVKTDSPTIPVLNVTVMRNKNGQFEIGDGQFFRTLSELVNYYRTHEMVDKSGIQMMLKQAVDTTNFKASDIEVRVAQLEKEFVCNDIRRNGFWEEFQHLQDHENAQELSKSFGAKLENKRKNRFKNILPYDHSRVILKDGNPKEAESDYINANHISMADGSMPSGQRRYIACQGCLSHTIPDFWRMILQEKCSIIVMITKVVENGKNKCVPYWPEQVGEKLVLDVYQGQIIVTFTDTLENNVYTKRTLTLEKRATKDKNKSKRHDSEPWTVYQYHYKEWEDKQIPKLSDTDALLQFNDDVNTQWSQTKYSSPMVVHCSAGIGRTGTFIVIDYILSQLKHIGGQCDIDVAHTITVMREQRAGLVQTYLQYKFIHLAIKRYLEQSHSPPRSPLKSPSPLYGNISNKPPPPKKPTQGTVRGGSASVPHSLKQAAPLSPAPPNGHPANDPENFYENVPGAKSGAGTYKAKPK